MKIISVIPLKKGILKGDLTYFSSLNISVGNIVSVPVRSKKTLALVTSVEELEEAKSQVKGMRFNLRKVLENKGESIFRKEFWETVFATSKYFAQNKNAGVAALIPNIFLEKYDKIGKSTSPPAPLLSGEGGRRSGEVRPEKLLFQYPFADRISVYKTLIRESFARGKSVFIVLPTELDIEKFTRELSRGIEQFTFPLHSGTSAKKNLLAYEKIITATHPVLIIGTSPFLSIPKKEIGTIILEHESSGVYRMIERPHFDLRIFTEIYASKINAKFILADEMLRYETVGRKDLDNLGLLHPLYFRIDFAGEIEIDNPRNHLEALLPSGSKASKFRIFSDKNIKEIKSALENKKSVFVFSLRKGLATETVCKDCGETISCEQCGSPLVLYLSHLGKKRMFVCNRCQMNIEGDTVCRSCGSWNLQPLGIGTDTVCEEIKEILSKEADFSKVKIFKLDKESAKTAAGAKKIIKEFEENPGSILIGTEMAFFYLQNEIPLSIIASFDSLWSIPNFKMSEKIIQIILAVGKIAKEKFIIQIKNENDPTIEAILSGNLSPFVREELEDRKKLNYPPYRRFIKITHLGDKEQTGRARKFLEENFKEYAPEIFSGFVAKLGEKYVTNALVKVDPQKWSLPALKINSTIDENLLHKLLALPPNFEVFVDPEDLL